MLTLSSGSLYKYGLNRVFHIAKKLGFEGVEVMVNDIADTRNAKYLKELSRQYDLPITSLVTPKGCNRKIFNNVLQIAEDLGIDVLVIRAPKWKDFAYANFLKKDLPRLQNITRVKLCLENPKLGDSYVFPSFAFGNVNEFKRFKYMSLDTSHLFSRNLDLMRIYSLLKSQITHVHFSDVRKNHEHIMPGDGVLPLESFLTRLKKDDYKGQICVKLHFDQLGYNEETVEERLKAVKEYYESYFVE